MDPLPNKSGSLPGESSPLNKLGLSLAGVKPGFPLGMLFPLTAVLAAMNRPVPGLSFAQIKPRFPVPGLLSSAVVHAGILILFLFPPLFNSLNPPRIIEARWDDLRPMPHDSLVMTQLSYSARMELRHPPTAIPATGKPSNTSSPHRSGNTPTPPARHEQTATAHSIYAGPQEVVSLFPDSTNSIQTILRPDLVNPPTLKFPQLLKPVVILPSGAPAASAEKPANPVALRVTTQSTKNTPVEVPVAKVAGTASAPVPETQHQPLPQIESEIPASGPLATIVLNAVTVPENAPVEVPPAELHGSFAVRPVRSVQSGAGGGISGESTKSSNATKAANELAQAERGEAVVLHSETATRKGAYGPNATGTTANSTGNSDPNRSGQVTGTSQAANAGVSTQVAHGVPGITIIGGTSRGGSSVDASTATHARYGLTVISSGTSGGASRDLGVFDRSETVYTVYIPMADVGGGPDWSIQYAILDPLQAGNGLLTPPVAVKKARAVVTGDSPDSRQTIMFFSGVISPKGELTIKLPREIDTRVLQALDALRHWEFLPAQLNGIAVGIKVLVGVGTVSQ